MSLVKLRASPMAQWVKHPPATQETQEMQFPQEMQVQSLGQEDPPEKEMATCSVFLPGKSHGQRSLAGYSPKGHKELATELMLLNCGVGEDS